jgi:membrane protein required for beta-lactamase induction
MFQIQKLVKLSGEGNRFSWKKQFKKTKKAGKRALNTSKKVAYEKVETCRLIGFSYWLIGKEQIALKWWSKALSESENLGAKIEQAVTLREVARWFRESGSDHHKLQGLDADSLSRQANKLFEEMEIPNNPR